MEQAAVISTPRHAAARAKAGAPSISCHQMRLSFLRYGEVAIIAKVRGKGEMHHHLENLGFVEGAHVRVMSEAAGDLIVEIKGAHVALDKKIASRIITSAAA